LHFHADMKTNVSLSNDMLVAVDRLAERLDITRNDLVRKALERYLEQEGARATVLAAIGKSANSDDEDW
jgi:metal-responsive CopG/Arc/MetJ family transcriptional regulator